MAPRANCASAGINKRRLEAGPPVPPAPISRPVYTKRKRSQDPDAETEVDKPEGLRASKKPRSLSPELALAEEPQPDKPESAHHSVPSLPGIVQPPPTRPAPSHRTPPAPIPRSAGTKWKRLQGPKAGAAAVELEGVCPLKRARSTHLSESYLSKGTPQEASVADAEHSEGVHHLEASRKLRPSHNRLSEENLRIFEILSGKDMDLTTDRAPALKWTSSRRSTTASEVRTDRTHSTVTNAVYRHKHLVAAEVHIHADPPDDIKAAIDRIIRAPVSEERRVELRVMSQKLRDDCLQNVKAQAGEDGFVDPLHAALRSLGLGLCLRQKAKWQKELKPVVAQQLDFSSSFIARYPEVDNASDPPRKRQQSAGEPYITPQPSSTHLPAYAPANYSLERSMMPPLDPSLEKAVDSSSIKTPCPDISIGIPLETIISALSSQHLVEKKARKFLTWLQDEMVRHEDDGPLEPMLVLVPSPLALDLAFPFAVVEGKAYSMGKQIFEAENQAAVSGACALKIQLDLDSLADHALGPNTPPTSWDTQFPLFFSITAQGPIHELWVHWTVVEEGVRTFNSTLLDSCNALLPERGEAFILKLNNIGLWGIGAFMDSVIERLGKVARKSMT